MIEEKIQLVESFPLPVDESKMKLQKIVIIFAMEDEGKELIKSLSLSLVSDGNEKILTYELYQGYLDEIYDIHVVLNGKNKRFGIDEVGTVPAAVKF